MENSYLQNRSVIASTSLISWASRLASWISGISNKRMITVVFRYDDYSELSPMDIEQNIFNAFHKHRFPYSVGVIPYSVLPNVPSTLSPASLHLPSPKIDLLKSALESGLIDIALHGYSHEDISDGDKPWNTEFLGLNYLAQLEKISKGKLFLEETLGVNIHTFVPPWNTYDQKTLSSLTHLGFECLSADMHGEVDVNSGLKFLPATVELYELKLAIEKARMILANTPVIVALFHPYDFEKGSEIDDAGFVQLLEWIKQQKDIQVQSIGQVLLREFDLSPAHFLSYKASLTRPRVAPAFLYLPLNGIYPSIATINRMNRLSQSLTLLFFLSVLVLSMLVASLLEELFFMLLPIYVDIYQIGLTALLVTLSLYALRNLALGFRGAVTVAATLGAILGIWITDL